MESSVAMWTTVAMILMVIIGCILVVFLGFLARTAYEVKVELKTTLDRGLRLVEEEGAKKSRTIRRDLIEEVARSRESVVEDSRRRYAEAMAALDKRQAEFETAVRSERVGVTVALDTLNEGMTGFAKRIDEFAKRINELERELLVGSLSEEPPQRAPAPVGVSQISEGDRAPAAPVAGASNLRTVV
jgi:hypothetical protein